MKNRFNNYLNKSCYDLLKEACNLYKEKVALISNNDKVKYNTLLNKIDECSLAFKKIGVTDKDTVTIMSSNSIEFIICFYALNKLGITVNMVNPKTHEKEFKNIISKTNSSYLIVDDILLNKVDKLNFKRIIYFRVIETLGLKDKLKYLFSSKININSLDIIPYYRFILKGKYSKDIVKPKKNDISLIINNNSKSIVLTNSNINSYALSIFNKNVFNDKKVFTNYNYTDSYGLALIHLSLISGSTFIVGSNGNFISKYKPNIIECNTNYLNTLLTNRKLNSKDLSFIELIICTKEGISDLLKNKIDKFLINHGSSAKVINNYGMVECTSSITWSNEKCDSVGKCLNGSIIKIYKSGTFDLCKNKEIGEICISGPTVMKEYLDTNDNKDKLIKYKNKIWLRAGDLGYIDNGEIYFKSSIKRVIISNGNRIYPSEIEEIILAHPYVKACSIVGVPHPYKKEVVKVYIVLKDNLILNSVIKKSIKEYCEENIPEYALPYAYGYRKELPETISGKIAYQELINTKEEN